jgi:hypothetical protein
VFFGLAFCVHFWACFLGIFGPAFCRFFGLAFLGLLFARFLGKTEREGCFCSNYFGAIFLFKKLILKIKKEISLAEQVATSIKQLHAKHESLIESIEREVE